MQGTHTHQHRGWLKTFFSASSRALKEQKMNSALRCSISHSWLVFPELLMGDTCLGITATFNILKCRTQGGNPLHRMTMHVKKRKKSRIAALKIGMYLWWESTLQMRLSEKQFLRQVFLRNCTRRQAAILPKDTTVVSDYEGMKGQKGNRELFISSGLHMLLTLGKRCIPEKLTANWNFYNLNHAFSNTILEKNGSTEYFKL